MDKFTEIKLRPKKLMSSSTIIENNGWKKAIKLDLTRPILVTLHKTR